MVASCARRMMCLDCLPDGEGSIRCVPSSSALKTEGMVLLCCLLRCLKAHCLGGTLGCHHQVRAFEPSYPQTAASGLHRWMTVSLGVQDVHNVEAS